MGRGRRNAPVCGNARTVPDIGRWGGSGRAGLRAGVRMFDFLKQVSTGDHHMDVDVLAGRLVAAFVLGALSALIHSLTCVRNGRGPDRPFLATLLLLPVLIALVTVVIGDNAA